MPLRMYSAHVDAPQPYAFIQFSQGVIINGAVRDSAEIAKLPFGCKALGTMPRKSEKRVPGAYHQRARHAVSLSSRVD